MKKNVINSKVVIARKNDNGTGSKTTDLNTIKTICSSSYGGDKV